MKLEFIIKNLVHSNKIKTQYELTEILSKKGFTTTQSNISRILKKLNAVKIVDENKDMYYIIHSKPIEIGSWAKNMVTVIEHNNYNVVIKTYNRAADLIGQIIDERSVKNVLATLSGNGVVLVIPEDIGQIDDLVQTLKDMFMMGSDK
jgi:transcriptional regulator of arginine metabolism